MGCMKDRWNIEQLLAHVEKPSRYIGGEVNSVARDRRACDVSCVLAFPDVYEVGMSHLGLQILYAVLNKEDRVAAERVFAPWPDMENQLRSQNVPLVSLESRTPLGDFDIVGFSLQYELSYTNVLAMLELGGVPRRAAERGQHDPIVIAGGPCVVNPAPMTLFFDAFVIGEGEEVIREIVRSIAAGKRQGARRENLLMRLADIEGVFVPLYSGSSAPVVKRSIADFDGGREPLRPVIPVMEVIHDRISLEIARGCSAGCRFCQAGMVWRPVRERRPENLIAMAEAILAATGQDELSLLSLSSGDYSCIEWLLTALMNRHYDDRIALALPSLRVETLTDELIAQIKKVRKTSFTLAPEAGTERLRTVINKGNTEADLLATTRRVFNAGWRSVKLYFMLGLPTERWEDLEGIVDLAEKVLREGGKKRRVTVSLSTFIPKPHTPFQWERQIGIDEIEEKQDFFKKRLLHHNISMKWHDKRMSYLEGILSRGDERVASLVEKAYLSGCRFDGWSDQLDFTIWERVLRDAAIDPAEYLRARNEDESFPWDRIDCGVTREFLLAERHKALSGETTENCRTGGCCRCGACQGDLRIRTVGEPPVIPAVAGTASPSTGPTEEHRLRITFAKEGRARFLSHHEVVAALTRGMRMGGLPFVFSEGFHPHPRISFPYALPVGTECRREFFDLRVRSLADPLTRYQERINDRLPEGLTILGIECLPAQAPSVVHAIRAFRYEIFLPREIMPRTGTVTDSVAAFLVHESFPVERKRKGKTVIRDIRPFVESLSFDDGLGTLFAVLLFSLTGGLSPRDLLTAIVGLDPRDAASAYIVKTDVIFAEGTDPCHKP